MSIGKEFLPVSKADIKKRWMEQLDFVDAYVGHPSFGAGAAKITAKCGGKAASCNVTAIGYTPGAFTISYVKVQSKPNCYALKIENPSANLITIYPTKAKIYDKTKKAYAVTQICGNDLKPAKKVSIGNGVSAVGFYSDFELTGSKYERVLFRFQYSGKWYQGLYSVKYGFTYKEL